MTCCSLSIPLFADNREENLYLETAPGVVSLSRS